MTAVLRDALLPNLVQTEEGGPAIVHCGPFGNIAHGCNSILATRLAMNLGDYAITEAGFGFDLGGEKFLDIKCRQAGIWPRAVVHRRHAARAQDARRRAGEDLRTSPTPRSSKKGIEHLEKHLETAHAFGLKPIVAINVFPNDTEERDRDGRDGGRRARRSARPLARASARAARARSISRASSCEVVDATDAAPPAAALPLRAHRHARRRRSARSRTPSTARRTSIFTAAAEKNIAARSRRSATRELPDLHGQDADVAHRRSDGLRAPARLHDHRARGAPLRGRRLPRRR